MVVCSVAVAGCEHGAGAGSGGRGADTIRRVKVKMSSVSAQGVVERASAELSRRITGLGLRGRKRSPGVVERVANALCGPASAAAAPRVPRRRRPSPRPLVWSQFVLEDRFLEKFFLYFNANDRRNLAQVCTKWRDVLYASPRWWSGLVAVLDCRELRSSSGCCMQRFYNTLVRRGIRGVVLVSASDDDINEFIRQFPLSTHHVHAISLKGCTITDRGLEAILDHLQVLFELELTGCNEITEAGLWACLTPRIVSLTLTDCINIADEAVGAVAQLLPSLYEFSLQAYHVTDAALGYFSPKQSSSLSVLRLHSCWELTNHGVVNIVHSLPNLTVLSLSGCSKVTDEGVELLAENLPRLRSLDLSWCPRVTDNALEYIACDLNHLEELTLDRCVHITDIGVGYISTMQSLQALFLRWCSQLRDFGVQHLCGMRSLQLLSLAGCPLLTSGGLSSLIQLRQLRELELTNCPGASPELFDYLHEHLPRCVIIE
ncbi:F-box/LRR-repeat protein 16 isoform X1 [Amyelois transitella]|uniref:F-box/LRR-repeat protein 16 isoform X1 n=2 Tax=Amyelois transitella TaxID=680683 RepID=UPI00298F80C6|nr:F-box/LRR-repeat protein 16 isoform X1 [Amyelois transitella]